MLISVNKNLDSLLFLFYSYQDYIIFIDFSPSNDCRSRYGQLFIMFLQLWEYV